jgi:RNA polymerase sigma-70 factor (ECF subfamily)
VNSRAAEISFLSLAWRDKSAPLDPSACLEAAAKSRAANRAEGAREMDEQQFQRLYDATARPIHRYVLGVTGRRDVADDVLQETYVRLLTGRGHSIAENEVRPYLFRVATNLLRDRWRRERDAQLPEGFEVGHTVDLNVRLDVLRVIESLKPRERELLWLAYVEGLSHAEIAFAMRLTVLSVRPLLFRARRKAAGLLGHGEVKR